MFWLAQMKIITRMSFIYTLYIYMETKQLLAAAKTASKTLIGLDDKLTQDLLTSVAHDLLCRKEVVLVANQKDLDRMPADNPKHDSLKLSEERLTDIARDIETWHRFRKLYARVPTAHPELTTYKYIIEGDGQTQQ